MKSIIFVSVLFNFFISFLKQEQKPMFKNYAAGDSTMRYKLTAFTILQNKCNVCHEQRNRNAVFTMNNMNEWSADINEQVFIKERMPKGNTIVLTYADKETLKKWIRTIK